MTGVPDRDEGRKPRLLDLFCGAGGAAMGYSRAGFEVVGVDIAPQPHYPFEFVQADVMELLGKLSDCVDEPGIISIGTCPHADDLTAIGKSLELDARGVSMTAANDRESGTSLHGSSLETVTDGILHGSGVGSEGGDGDTLLLAPALASFAAIHASPPCQAYTSLRSLHKQRDYPDLIAPTRELLLATGLPYVIENVELARRQLRDPILICGSMFDPPMDVKRHRYFEANWPLAPTMWPCRHKLWDFRYRSLDQRKKRGSRVVQVHGGNQHGKDYLLSRVVGVHGHTNYAGEAELRNAAMEIDWMSQDELSEAIPPRYTELIGTQLLQHLRMEARVA